MLGHMRASLAVASFAAVIVSGCALRFGPGFSLKDGRYFAESPRVVVRGDAHVLRWRYGEMGFFFSPSSKVMDGQLLFALQGTSSTGAFAGQYGELPIEDPKQIHALETGGGFWVEPDGRRVPLEIVRE
jgi:hypothetical protein